MLNKNFAKFVQNSCSDVVTQDAEYMELQRKLVQAEEDNDLEAQEEYSSRMEVRAEEVCFTAGWNAAIQFCLKGAAI
jgi:hypothetical protein